MADTQQKQLYKYLLFLYFANLSAISASYSLFMLPEGMVALDATSAFIGIVLGAPRLVLLVLSLFLRGYSGNINEHKMSFWGGLIGIFVFSVLALSTNLKMILVFSFLYGFTYTVGMTYMLAMAIRYIPKKNRMSIMGLFTTSASLGVSIGPIASSFFGYLGKDTGFPNFLVFGGALLCLIWTISTYLASKYSKTLTRYDEPSAIREVPPKGFAEYAQFMPIAVIFGILFATLMTFTTAYAHEYDIKGASLFFTGFGMVALVERLFLFRKMSIWKKRHIIYGGFTAYYVGFTLLTCLFMFKSTPVLGSAMLVLSGMFIGSGHGVLYPTLSVLFTDLTPRTVSRATLTFVMCFMFAAVFSYPLGYLADHFGYPLMYMIVLISMSISMFYALFNKKTRAKFVSIEMDDAKAV